MDFCQNTGISYSNLKGQSLKSEIGGEAIGKILSVYPEINPQWLLTGIGNQTIDPQEKENPRYKIKSFCKAKSLQVLNFETKCGLPKGFVDNLEDAINKEDYNKIIRTYPELKSKLSYFVLEEEETNNVEEEQEAYESESGTNMINIISSQQDTINRLTKIIDNLIK